MWKQAEVAKTAGLVNEQVESLSREVTEIRLNHRADIDTLKIELKAMQLLICRGRGRCVPLENDPLLQCKTVARVSPSDSTSSTVFSLTVFPYGSKSEGPLQLGLGETAYEREHFAKCDPGACRL